MTSTRAINAAAGVIHAAMQQGKTLPIAHAYALDAACLLNSPELAAELVSLRTEVVELRARVAELEAQYLPVDEQRIPFALTPEALHASSGAVIEVPARPEDVSRQVQQLRGFFAGQSGDVEDPHDSDLYHRYQLGRDLPEPGVKS